MYLKPGFVFFKGSGKNIKIDLSTILTQKCNNTSLKLNSVLKYEVYRQYDCSYMHTAPSSGQIDG